MTTLLQRTNQLPAVSHSVHIVCDAKENKNLQVLMIKIPIATLNCYPMIKSNHSRSIAIDLNRDLIR